MSYDLFFYRDCQKDFHPESVRNYFASQFGFEMQGIKTPGFQAWYENEKTGVYCSFEYDDAPEEDSAPTCDRGYLYTGLSFNLNYNRATFFALETMPLVQSIAEKFQLLTADPQEDLRDVITPVKPMAEALISSWQRHNTGAVSALHDDTKDEPKYLYYPREKALYWWRYTREQDAIQERLGDDVFVPSITLIGRPDEALVHSMVVWSDALPQVFPSADYVLLNRMARDSTGELVSKEMELLSWHTVRDEIGPLADPYHGAVHDLLVVPSERRSKLRKVFDRLEGSEFEGYQFVGSDGFVDVPLEGRLPERVQ